MKYIGVLRDTARAPKPTTQYNTIQYHAIERSHVYFKQTNKGALTAGNKIIGYSSRAALAKDMLVIPLGKNIKIQIYQIIDGG